MYEGKKKPHLHHHHQHQPSLAPGYNTGPWSLKTVDTVDKNPPLWKLKHKILKMSELYFNVAIAIVQEVTPSWLSHIFSDLI